MNVIKGSTSRSLGKDGFMNRWRWNNLLLLWEKLLKLLVQKKILCSTFMLRISDLDLDIFG